MSTPISPAAPVVVLLDELRGIVQLISDAQYVQAPVGVMPGSIGGHVRHGLDHVQALLNALNTGMLDYDHRERGTPVETQRQAAIDLMTQQAQRLEALPADVSAAPLSVRVKMTSDGHSVEVESSVGRELAFVLSHTIHHNAIIGAMVRTLGLSVPETFGYAPSTLAYEKTKRSSSC